VSIKWDKLKKRVASEVYTQILTGYNPDAMLAACFDSMAERRKPRESLKALADRVYDVVMHWDIRCAGKLVAAFPWAAPKFLRGVKLTAECNEKDEWLIEPIRT
jgi:hypothetical protein